jgi:hypothetical protein
MRVIIMGGTGFIGSRLVELLLDAGREVAVLSRSKDSVRRKFGDRVIAAEWDAESSAGWLGLLDDAEGDVAVVNLAGESIADGRWSDEKKRRILNSRVRSGNAVVEACETASRKPAVVIQGSAVGWYGPRGDEELDEDSVQGDGFLAEVCGKWEASSKPVEKLGIRRVVARTGIVLGQGGILDKFVTPFKFFVGGPLGSGEQWLSWVHMDDEVRALKFLMDAEDASGPFNITAPNPVTMREFTNYLGKAMNRPSFFKVPSALLKLGLGEMAEEMILGGQKVYPSRILEKNFEFEYPSIEGAFNELL